MVAIEALENYAEDFILKPYPIPLLTVRTKRLLSRFAATVPASVVVDVDYVNCCMGCAGQEVRITVDLGLGHGRARVWTCDLTHGYISINADYRS